MPALNFPVRLRVIGRRPDMRHPREPDELLEVSGDELRPIIRDDPRPRLWEILARSLEDHFDLTLCHLLAQFPGDDIATAAAPAPHTSSRRSRSH
jgi:hypothetical protein